MTDYQSYPQVVTDEYNRLDALRKGATDQRIRAFYASLCNAVIAKVCQNDIVMAYLEKHANS